jgi:protein ImuA
MGLDVSSLVLGLVEDEASLLRAAADAARCHGLGTLLIESWGRAPGIDLTATRRLMLAAEASGVTILSLRIGAEPVPSAAASRWQVAACRSRPLEADAPGKPAFDIELLRRRGGQAGLRWRVEWDRDAYIFDQAAFETAVFDTETGGDSAAIPGAGVSVAADRAVADDAAAFVRRTG